jgi:hypothetical protein
LCNFLHSPVTSSLPGPIILLRALFSNTLSLYSSLSLRDQVSHPYKSTGRIMVLYILTFTFLDSRRDEICSHLPHFWRPSSPPTTRGRDVPWWQGHCLTWYCGQGI